LVNRFQKADRYTFDFDDRTLMNGINFYIF
jgi:hypothetical protein